MSKLTASYIELRTPMIAAMILAIATVDVWNRLNVVTRQAPGEWAKSVEAKRWAENGAGRSAMPMP